MYAIQEISTGYWLLKATGGTFVPWSSSPEPDILEKPTEAELEEKRDALNATSPGRTGIFSSPRPH